MSMQRIIASVLIVVCCGLWHAFASAARISDIANTKHNFSAVADPLPTVPAQNGVTQPPASRVVQATSEQQICVFCHTPHGATLGQGPLWNRQISGDIYTSYTSNSLDAVSSPIEGVSKLCLSCHDGTMAIGAVNVLNGAQTDGLGTTAEIAMSGTELGLTGTVGAIAQGDGATTGFTRYIGTDLTNDHPISVQYDSNLANNTDGDMRDPTTTPSIVRRGGPVRPAIDDIQLDAQGRVQCNSCHDPHIRDDSGERIKFLRLNRFQKVNPTTRNFDKQDDIICLACHDKVGWIFSAHANEGVADEVYTDAAADVRDFPRGTQVWQSACLACHDTHTVQGSRRLLREGTDGAAVPSVSNPTFLIKPGGGGAAIEEACYACHSNRTPNTATLQGQGQTGFQVPDIETDFGFTTHMPITTSEQNANQEVHDIGTSGAQEFTSGQLGMDFIESRELMGLALSASATNRHAECTDCHNVHRVIKNRRFNDDPSIPGVEGTHDHFAGAGHTNIASGVLRGTWGVEPSYPSNSFGTIPDSFTVLRGNPAIGASTALPPTTTYVTREYQVCLKCHSNYAFGTTPPLLSQGGGGATSSADANGLETYTNVAMEYRSPLTHQGEQTLPPLGIDGGAGSAAGGTNNPNWDTNNHRGWHPVMRSTGRTPAQRVANANNWITPFNTNVGNLTMYCTDCHGRNTGTETVVPGTNNVGIDGAPWGPHGSENNFILKGRWSAEVSGGTGEGAPLDLCFKCHDFNEYANAANTAPNDSGFASTAMCGGMCAGGMMMGGMAGMNNLHVFHALQVTNFRCSLCHVAVPHGWKNKAFLVNLNDVGPESTNGDSSEVRNNTEAAYFNPPYYWGAALKINTFARSGMWIATDCGSAGINGNGVLGVDWMTGLLGGGGGGMMGVPDPNSESCQTIQ